MFAPSTRMNMIRCRSPTALNDPLTAKLYGWSQSMGLKIIHFYLWKCFFGIPVSAASLCSGQKKQNQSSKFSGCMIHVDARLLELLVNEFCYLKPEPGQLSPLFFQSSCPATLTSCRLDLSLSERHEGGIDPLILLSINAFSFCAESQNIDVLGDKILALFWLCTALLIPCVRVCVCV